MLSKLRQRHASIVFKQLSLRMITSTKHEGQNLDERVINQVSSDKKEGIDEKFNDYMLRNDFEGDKPEKSKSNRHPE